MQKQQEPQLIMLGMYPWTYTELNDTVRCFAKAFQQTNVVYINPQSDSRGLGVQWERRRLDGMDIWNPPFSVLPTRYGIHRLREKLSARSLLQALEDTYGEKWSDHSIFYVTASTLELSYEYVKYVQPKRLVFDILDDNLGFPGISMRKKDRLTQMFQYIASRAERITAVSQQLVEQTQQLTGKSVYYLPNGVDVDHFLWKDDYSRDPADLVKIPHPRLTFVGAITHWIDLALLEKTAIAFPDTQIVLVGPVYVQSEALERLRKMENVHLLGSKSFDEVPNYLHVSDVLLLPRTYDPHSLACDPLKLYEYIVTGKPIVSTAHPSTERFAQRVEIGHDADGFIAGIEHALKEIQQNPLEAGKKHWDIDSLSWKARTEKMLALLQPDCHVEAVEDSFHDFNRDWLFSANDAL